MSRYPGLEGENLSEDPRVLRTKRRLKRALLELMDDVGYERVTIELLTERADVARSTFYVHYSAKEDLLFEGFDAWLLSFSELGPSAGSEPWGFAFSLPLLRHGATQRKFFRETILRGPSHRVRRRLREILTDVALREMTAAEVNVGRSAEVAGDVEARRDLEAAGRARAVAGAFLGLFEWWLEEARDLPAEQIDGIFQRTVAGGTA